MLAMTRRRASETVKAAALQHLEKTTAKANMERWQDTHGLIKVEECERLGKVPEEKRPSHVAQRCICSGAGLRLPSV
eukprot:5027287-Pyramimonas_sp.AAC.1